MSYRRQLTFERLERRELLATIVGTEGADTLTGTPLGDSIFGLGNDDILQGSGGNDVLRGGDDNDQVIGGDGNDLLYGDAGADMFLFDREVGSQDTIKDFNPLQGDRVSFAPVGADVYYDVIQGAAGAQIVLANNQSIVLEGVDLEDFETYFVKSAVQGLEWLDWSFLSGNKYRYAPSGIQVGDTRYIYHCATPYSGIFTDYIMMRKETLIGGTWTFDSEQIVLSPGSAGAWDALHVCDPSVTKGNFNFQGTEYQYAMFYLGYDQYPGGINQIGFALANSLEGPWVKVTVNEPLVDVPPGETNAWGAGQPSATSVSGGTVMLVYTRERPGQIPYTYRQVIDLSTAESPVVTHPEMQLSVTGLKNINGSPDPVNHGGAVAYDPQRDVFWIIRSMHPFPGDNPSYIAPALQIASIPGNNVWNGGGTWTVLEELHGSEMGTDRVFDGGFLRNGWGQLFDTSVVQAIPSVALSQATTGNPIAEWTYRTHLVDIHLDLGPADFNSDGTTASDDLGHWLDGYGVPSGASRSDGDSDNDGDVDGFDFLAWQLDFDDGAVAVQSEAAVQEVDSSAPGDMSSHAVTIQSAAAVKVDTSALGEIPGLVDLSWFATGSNGLGPRSRLSGNLPVVASADNLLWEGNGSRSINESVAANRFEETIVPIGADDWLSSNHSVFERIGDELDAALENHFGNVLGASVPPDLES